MTGEEKIKEVYQILEDINIAYAEGHGLSKDDLRRLITRASHLASDIHYDMTDEYPRYSAVMGKWIDE
jgi:hypothetical protein